MASCPYRATLGNLTQLACASPTNPQTKDGKNPCRSSYSKDRCEVTQEYKECPFFASKNTVRIKFR